AQVRQIKKLLRHENYERHDMSYDIALLQLSKPVECSPYIQLACVADPILGVSVSEEQTCWIAGWGATSTKNKRPSDRLQEAKVHLINLQLCNSTFWYSGTVHPYNLCAGYPQGKIDTCQGDSGGPLMCQDNHTDSWWVVGVTSWGKSCGRARRPGVYTSAQYFYDWILVHMG
ncbi:ACRO protein, partial [Sylvia borin]|nr:ACRO protein [Sylvia borin]